MLIAILGAGSASRFGADKLNAPCAGKPVGQWAMEAALGLGSYIHWVGGETPPPFLVKDCNFHSNRDAHQGLSTSLALAARLAESTATPALLILLADMPLVSTQLLERLVEAGPFAACAYDEKAGVPALFPARLFGKIVGLSGDRGAGPLLRDEPGLELIAADREALLDIDTPEALAQVERLLASKMPPEGGTNPLRRQRF